MPIPGTFGGFPFDPEVYQGFVDQEATFSDSILASEPGRFSGQRRHDGHHPFL